MVGLADLDRVSVTMAAVAVVNPAYSMPLVRPPNPLKRSTATRAWGVSAIARYGDLAPRCIFRIRDGEGPETPGPDAGSDYGQQGASGKHAGGGAAGFAGTTVEGATGVSVRSTGASMWVRVSTTSTRITPPRSAPRAHRVGMTEALREPG